MTVMFTNDPLDIEFEPGRKIRDLATVADCASAVIQLENEMSSIMSQISRQEADPNAFAKGWRGRAQNAMRWKKRVKTSILAHAAMLNRTTGDTGDKRRAILRTIREVIGADEFERLVALSQRQNPQIDWNTP